MANIFDYLLWRGDLSLNASPFNAVDNLIVTHLSYLPFEGIVPGIGAGGRETVTVADAAKAFGKKYKNNPSRYNGILNSKEDPAFLEACGASARYKDMRLTAYINSIDPDKEKQFAALTVLTGDKSAFAAFRGTDNSIVGWKEDFNMSFSPEVPSQAEAVRYLEKIARRYGKPLRVGGHSKGGNLAIYAAAFCSPKIRKRITAIYANDAPGLSRKMIASEGYQAIREKIFSFVPETSIIGLLFEHEKNYTVVKSVQTGLLQHDVYSWQVTREDVERLEKINKESRFIEKTLKEWLSGIDNKQRQDFTEALFKILGSLQVSLVPELGDDWLKTGISLIQSLGSIDDKSRTMLFKTLGALLHAAKNNINFLLKPAPKKTAPGPLSI
ncbi:MAG: DUF2974 domain-containing protein [Treponema sp.]|jgi:hypothetical protein|nr:DUF2974 domain-containing protein [Treponema sp.]